MPEFEINNFQGIHRGSVKPPKNAASELRNFDLRGQGGVLEQRFGYGLAFDNKPEATSVANNTISFHNAESFYIPGVGSGQEITVQVGVGTITKETITYPAITKNIPLIWASHSWDGSAWQAKTSGANDWNWLNETVYTSLVAVDPASAGDNHYIATDIEDDGRVASKYFNGWYVANGTVVRRIVDSYVWVDGANNRIAFKLDGNADDFVLLDLWIMKSYIPIVSLIAMGAAVRNDVTFLKIRDELRISFGAKVDRIALAVSYQKSYLNIKEFDVEAYSTALIDAYCETDGLVITPYTLLTEDIEGVLSYVTGGTMPADTYYVRITGEMIAGDEILLIDELKVTTTTLQNLYVNLFIKVATLNKRIYRLKYYFASETGLRVYYYIGEEILNSDRVREEKYSVNNEGNIALVTITTQYHDPAPHTNAAAPATSSDPLSVGGWAMKAVLTDTVNSVGDTGAGSVNVLECTAGAGKLEMTAYYNFGANFPQLTEFDLSFYVMRQSGSNVDSVAIRFEDAFFGSYGAIETIQFGSSWNYPPPLEPYTVSLKSPVKLSGSGHVMSISMKFFSSTGQVIGGEVIRFDRLSITRKNLSLITIDTKLESEMSVEMGYTPSRNLIKSWDTGLVTAGRTFVANAFIEKLYTNMIFYSAIGGDSNSMYDVLVAGLRYDVENFDGNDVRKIELLSNADFLLLQSTASQRLDPDSGRTANVGFGSGTVQPFGSVNFGDKIIFPSKYDILATSGIGSVTLSEDSIRGVYRDLSDAEIAKVHASKDVFGDAYVLYSGRVSTKAEYIYLNKGWIERRLFNEPQRYYVTREGELRFLSSGNIFNISKAATSGDNSNPIVSLWQSIVIDAETIGEQISADMRFVITDFFVEFISNDDLTFKFYLLDKLVPVTHDTQVIPKTATTGKLTYRRPLKGQAVCSRFQLELSYTGDGGPSECSVYSIGVVYEVIKAKLHA